MSDFEDVVNGTDDFSDIEGFEEKRGSGMVYFRIFDKSICMTSKEPREGFEEKPIETRNPSSGAITKTYVKRFDRLVARIVGFRRDKKEFKGGGKGVQYSVYLMAGDKKASLQFMGTDPTFKRFLKVAPNIDFTRPILISAFPSKKTKGGEVKWVTAISFRQGEGKNVDQWTKVDEFWKRPVDDEGNPLLNKPAKGPDGSKLPPMVHDEDEDTWDSKQQDKFLREYFKEHVLPKIEAIEQKYKAQGQAVAPSDKPEGGSGTDFNFGDNRPIPVVTEKPEDPQMKSLDDAMTSDQRSTLKKMFKHIGKDPEKSAQKMLGVGFDELSIEAGSYLTYKLQKRIDALVEEGDLEPFVDPDKIDVKKALLEEGKSEKTKRAEDKEANTKALVDDDDDDDDDDDSWGEAEAPKAKAAAAGSDEDDDEF
jgi:hypothetical protein